jgi:hypothetical protein
MITLYVGLGLLPVVRRPEHRFVAIMHSHSDMPQFLSVTGLPFVASVTWRITLTPLVETFL